MNTPALFIRFDELKRIPWINDGTINAQKCDTIKVKLQSCTYGTTEVSEEGVMRITSKEVGVEVGWLLGLMKTKKMFSKNNVFISIWAEVNKISKEFNLSFEVDTDLLRDIEHLSPKIIIDGTLYTCHVEVQPNGITNEYWKLFYLKNNGIIETARGTLFLQEEEVDLLPALRDEIFQVSTVTNDAAVFKNIHVEIYWEKCIRQSPYNISNITTSQFTDDSFKDLIVAVEDGTEFSCHKSIIAAQSTALAAMINPKTGMEESLNSRIQLLGIGKEAFGILLPYLYGRGISVSKLDPPNLVELLLFAHQYDLRELEAQLKNVIEEKSQDLFPLETILNLYYFSSNAHGFERIKNQALGMISNVRVEVENCELFNGLSKCEQNKLKTAVDDYQEKKETL